MGHHYSKVFIPIFTNTIKVFRPEYQIEEIALKDPKNIYYKVKVPIKMTDENGNTVIVDVQVKDKTLVSVLYIHPIIIFSIILALPAFTIIERLKTAVFSLPFLFAVQLIDMPFHLIYLIEKSFAIKSIYMLILMYWGKILNNGGRQFLSLLAVLLSIAPHFLIKPAVIKDRIGRNDPCPCGSGKKYKKCCMLK